MNRTKYPRTMHLPWSYPSSDDKILTDTSVLFNADVVVTEKLDGENTTMYTNYMHARSLTFASHPSRGYVRELHAMIGPHIPEGWRVVGENVTAKHAIGYDHLPGRFVVFAVFDEKNLCLSFDETKTWASLLDLPIAPVLYEGQFDEQKIKACFTGKSTYGGEQEGYVVRVKNAFMQDVFSTHVAKFVRPNHVQPDSVHWASAPVVFNKLGEENQ